MIARNDVLKALEAVKFPGARANILELGQLKNLDVQEQSVLIKIQMPEANSVFEKSIRFQIEKAVKTLSSEAQVTIEVQIGSTPVQRMGAMIAVGSGKGGVGKSAVAVNLAVAFQRLGYSTGILDCDVYGPSIPTMLGVADKKPMLLDKKIQPIEAHSMKVMSAGFLVEPGQSLVWRGPMIHKLLQQFANDVNWEGVDVLIVDLPPGTGDAPLSLSQAMPLTGAVMVSTPQQVSLIDVHKGISMFHHLKIPILGVVENMSHFVCPSCAHTETIFDRGRVKDFCDGLSIPYLGDIPIESKIREMSDKGKPFLLEYPETPAGKAMMQIARRLQPFLKTSEDRLQLETQMVL